MAIAYRLSGKEWRGKQIQDGLMSVEGNVVEYGPDSHETTLFS